MTIDNNTILIHNIFSQLEVDIVKLAWGSFTTNTLFDDIFIDDLSSIDAINGSSSSYLYDAANDQVYKPTSSDMIIVTNSWLVSQNNPVAAFCLLEIIPPIDYVINTDIQVFVSSDNGTNYQQFTNLYRLFTFQSTNVTYLKGEISDLTPHSDNRMVLKIQTFNSIDIKVSAFSLGVRW